MGDEMQGVMESGAQQTAQNTHQKAQQAPFAKGFNEYFGMMDLVQPCHKDLFFLF